MLKASMVLAIIGGILGILIAVGATFMGSVFAFVGVSGVIWLGLITLGLSIIGLVAGIMVKKKMATSGMMMLVAGVCGLVALSFGFILPGILLILAGIFALVESKKTKAPAAKEGEAAPAKSSKMKGWLIWLIIGIVILVGIILIQAFTMRNVQSDLENAFQSGEFNINGLNINLNDLDLEGIE